MAVEKHAASGWAVLWSSAVIAVCLLQVALAVLHEPWLDEWQALQIGVQSSDFSNLMANLAYEGHPPLWYLVLRWLSWVTGPRYALPAASLVFGLGTQVVILFRSPFPRVVRVLIALSEPILFEYNTISRSFSLGVFLTLSTLALWPHRRSVWLPIALLPMADFLFGAFSAIFAILRWHERRLWWTGVATWVGVSVLAGWSVIPARDVAPAMVNQLGMLAGSLAALFRLGVTMVPFQWNAGPEWNSGLPYQAQVVMWLPFILLCYEITTGRRLHRALLFGFVALQIAFSVCIYPLQIRHAMLIGVLLIALQWLSSKEAAHPHPLFVGWLAICAASGLAVAVINFAKPFDTARAAASRINALRLADKHWLSFPESRAQGVTALTGIKFARLGDECMQDFPRWDYRLPVMTHADLRNAFRDKLERHGRYYLLSDRRLLFPGLVKQLAHLPAGYDGQNYYLYVVGKDRAERVVSLPPCSPGLIPLSVAAISLRP